MLRNDVTDSQKKKGRKQLYSIDDWIPNKCIQTKRDNYKPVCRGLGGFCCLWSKLKCIKWAAVSKLLQLKPIWIYWRGLPSLIPLDKLDLIHSLCDARWLVLTYGPLRLENHFRYPWETYYVYSVQRKYMCIKYTKRLKFTFPASPPWSHLTKEGVY